MRLHPFIVVLFLGLTAGGAVVSISTGSAIYGLAGFAAGMACIFVFRIANQWQRGVILRFGKYKAIKGPGFFSIIPFIDTIPYAIDLRTMTTPFTAEQTLTKDSVPVDVDAVLFWRV